MEPPNGYSMEDVRIQQLLQDAEDHLRQRDCRARYERAVAQLPDSRRGIRLKDKDDRLAS